MEKYPSDHDGKSKTASGVDQEHYPEQNEVEDEEKEVEAAKKPRGEVQGTVRPSGSVQH